MTAPATVPELDPAAAADRLAAGGIALDVREPYEWEAGRLAGSVNVPLGELAARQAEIPSAGALVVVCRSGSRSAAATAALRAAGYPAENLAGGLQAWARAGLPLEPPDAVVS